MTEIVEAEHWIESPAGRLYAKSWAPRDLNSKAPIILFHDSLGCVALWRDFPRLLAHSLGRRVIAYDRLGFGRSDARMDILERDFIALEAERVVPLLCEQLALREFIACGHSVGGGMAVETGARLAGCNAVITIAAQAFVEDRTLQGIRTAQQEFASVDTIARLAKYHGDKADWVLRAWTETWLAPDFAEWNLDAALERLPCPVIAIHGDRDEYGSLAHPRRIAAGRGSFHILPDTGHSPHRERPAEVIKVIEDFLAYSASPAG
ncbi:MULTISPECIES: alpha/beta fold hydrolase [Rhizobium]|uniref:Pimeloyl-ACP methyl ester carboxylesterase n=1 Tax=Rhizobium paranaense TaxID=1650438 RepID=A0A7W9D068_9HYPH|nr:MULTISPECIES: alpha/beta hydrolase [Rhizobium]MBB5572735.1 pimeloyl-ACP methyl ester carboxylesterase [Rhizobium paranaense]PST61814.1 alpha/beta hydrolase [Rhizobium sp. SEMIA4064]